MPGDFSELRSLAIALDGAGDRFHREAEATMLRAAFNLTRDLKAEAASSRSFKRVQYAIGFDVGESPEGIDVSIGPKVSGRRSAPVPRGQSPSPNLGQGSLAWIAYNGTARTAPSLPDPQQALDREAPIVQGYLAAAAAKAVLG